MSETIGNPLSWGARWLVAAGAHLASSTARLGGDTEARPEVRALTAQDIEAALRAGLADFTALRTDVVFLCLVYPIIGVILVWAALDRELVPLIFPLMSGFALIGPAAAVGLYEMSRRREAGQRALWADAFAVVARPQFGAIIVLTLGLLGLFCLWLIVASGIHAATMGAGAPASLAAFLHDVMTTDPGQTMAFVGGIVGAGFAALALVVSLVSFPMLLDRNVGLPVAVVTSVRVAQASPGAVALWGLIVAGSLILGAIPALLGLIVVLPVLGHATWHLYRRAVV